MTSGKGREHVSSEPLSGLWLRWSAITRFLLSARVAFARERELWTDLDLVNVNDVKFKARVGDRKVRFALGPHLAGLADETLLYQAVLMQSFALVESAAHDRLGLDPAKTAGIADWGGRLLTAAGSAWVDVDGGREEAVKIGRLRNRIAHGDQVELAYDDLSIVRARLRSLLNAGGLS